MTESRADERPSNVPLIVATIVVVVLFAIVGYLLTNRGGDDPTVAEPTQPASEATEVAQEPAESEGTEPGVAEPTAEPEPEPTDAPEPTPTTASEPPIGDGEEDAHGPPMEVLDTQQAVRLAAGDGNLDALRALIPDDGFTCSFGDPPDCVAYWEEQTQQGADPLGVLATLLVQDGTKQPGADRWVWPRGYATEEDYLGPRVGIDADGTWRFFVEGD